MTEASENVLNVDVNVNDADEQEQHNGFSQQQVDAREEKASEAFPLYGLACMYRPATDVVASVIVNARGEATSKFEIGKHLGLNLHSKAGNRKISRYIQTVTLLFPQYIDQFQRMTGKFRLIQYFLKESAPEQLRQMIQRFEQLAGVKCPFSFGQIIRFAGTDLTTLRISDVTFKRFLYVLELLEERTVIVPSNQLVKYITAKEEESGYHYKSITKCMLALQRNHICRILSGECDADGVVYELDIVTKPDVQRFDDPRVTAAIEAAKREFFGQGKVFPTGAPLPKKRPRDEVGEGETEQSKSRQGAGGKRKKGSKHAEELTSEAMAILTTKMTLPVLTSKTRAILRGKRTKRSAPGEAASSSRRQEVEQEEAGPSTSRSAARRDGKRKFDEIDVLSKEKSMYIRSRFTPRERDMLVLIRAVCQFLNPVGRLWLDAAVLRDIMHVYFEESRSKTVNALLAASARETFRNNRRENFDHIVKTLASYKEMRKLRSKCACVNLHDPKQANPFFLSAFETAYNLLFREEAGFPSISASEDDFQKYLEGRGIFFPRYADRAEPLPTRSCKALDIPSIQHSMAYNLIMSILLNDDFKKDQNAQNAEVVESLVKHIDAGVMATMLTAIQHDTLIATSKGTLPNSIPAKEGVREQVPSDNDSLPAMAPGEGPAEMPNQDTFKPKQTICSAHYRSFFANKFRTGFMESVASGLRVLEDSKSTREISASDDAGVFLAFSAYLCSEEDNVKISVPNTFGSVFVNSDGEPSDGVSNFTKQLRHLEKTDLQLQHITVQPAKASRMQPNFPDVTYLAGQVPNRVIDSTKQTPFSRQGDNARRELIKFIRSSGVVGVTEEEISAALRLPRLQIASALSQLEKTHSIFALGVDDKRYVAHENALCWMVRNAQCSFVPKPWSLPSGDINFPVLRWMAEAILQMVASKPGISVSEAVKSYAFALQPSLIMELLELLEKLGCLSIMTRTLSSIAKSSPFQKTAPADRVKFLLPSNDGLERFAVFMDNVIEKSRGEG